MNEEEYFKEITLGLDFYDWGFMILLFAIGLLIIFQPMWGIYLGFIPMFISILKLVFMDKDYHTILWLFVLSLFTIIFTGMMTAEIFMGILYFLTAIVFYMAKLGYFGGISGW